MNKSESQALTKAEQKEKIRQRYKGRDTEDVDVIPANKSYDFYDEVNRRVAVYVRVSTDNLQQTSSYELQKNYYEDMVNKNPHWELVHIYADEGISGTSLDHRDAFNQMIADCKAGKIDMIITKSVSRFARNVRDCITIVDELSELRNPIGVFFETEHIFTLDKKNEITLSFTASMAQEESHIKSNIMNASIEMRFSHGILLTPVLLGYDHDQEGNLVINKEEAETVRLIFFMYLYGFTIRQIAEQLTKLGRITKKGNTQWNSSSVVGILRNERYCGDVLTSKTFTPSYKNHKSRKNNGDRTQYRWKDQHEPIISRDDFIAVQHMMVNTKYGSAALPELKVIEKGPFKGFVRINTHWAVFAPENYYSASAGVYENGNGYEEKDEYTVQAETGQFDLRGFEIARSQFFESNDKLLINFSETHINFSTACINKLKGTDHIEIYVHPEKKLLFVKGCAAVEKNAMKWIKYRSDGKPRPRPIRGTAFLGTLFEMFGWNSEFKYRFQGVKKKQGNREIILFDLTEAEVFIPKDIIDEDEKESDSEVKSLVVGKGKSILAVPSEWTDTFGNEFYVHGERQEKDIDRKRWSRSDQTVNYSTMPELQRTDNATIASNIRALITNMKENTNA